MHTHCAILYLTYISSEGPFSRYFPELHFTVGARWIVQFRCWSIEVHHHLTHRVWKKLARDNRYFYLTGNLTCSNLQLASFSSETKTYRRANFKSSIGFTMFSVQYSVKIAPFGVSDIMVVFSWNIFDFYYSYTVSEVNIRYQIFINKSLVYFMTCLHEHCNQIMYQMKSKLLLHLS